MRKYRGFFIDHYLPARDSGLAFRVDWLSAIASRLAPTGASLLVGLDITLIRNQSLRQRDFLLPGSVLSGEPGQSELNFIQYLSGIHASPTKDGIGYEYFSTHCVVA